MRPVTVSVNPEDTLIAAYRRYRYSIQRQTYRIIGDEYLAQDATGEAFAALWQALLRGEIVGYCGPWLRRVAHNKAVDILRRRQAITREVSLFHETQGRRGESRITLLERIADPELVEENILYAEETALLQEIMTDEARKHPQNAELLVWFADGVPPQVLADLHELTVKAVYLRLDKLRARIRKRMAEAG